MNNGVRHSKKIKKHATQLRSKGFSILRIAKRLGVTKGTVSLWVRHIRLTLEQQQYLLEKVRRGRVVAGRRSAAISHLAALKRKEIWRKEADAHWCKLREDALFMIGLGLYWGEGAKATKALSLCNSDPGVHRVWRDWMRQFVPDGQIRYTVIIHQGINRTSTVAFWQTQLGIADDMLVSVTASRVQKKNGQHKLAHGTLTQTLRVGSTEWHAKVLRWIELAGMDHL